MIAGIHSVVKVTLRAGVATALGSVQAISANETDPPALFVIAPSFSQNHGMLPSL